MWWHRYSPETAPNSGHDRATEKSPWQVAIFARCRGVGEAKVRSVALFHGTRGTESGTDKAPRRPQRKQPCSREPAAKGPRSGHKNPRGGERRQSAHRAPEKRKTGRAGCPKDSHVLPACTQLYKLLTNQATLCGSA
jgi:hypothetical protein